MSPYSQVEIYDLEGRFEKEFYVSSPKYPITLVDGVEQDRLMVVGHSTGPVWIVDADGERTRDGLFRYNTPKPLVGFHPGPLQGEVIYGTPRNGSWLLFSQSRQFHAESRSATP